MNEPNMQNLHGNFIDGLRKTLNEANPNVSITENGAIGLKTTGRSIVDLNFKLSSMRNMDADAIWAEFLKAYNEDPALATVWLFFARDIRGGCGERRTFRIIFENLASEIPSLAVQLLNLIPEYGRWDDLIEIMFSKAPRKVRDSAMSIVAKQFYKDIEDAKSGKSISLLAKWMPSLVTSSKETRHKAEFIRSQLAITPKEYRKGCSNLRAYLNVIEQKMSANEWDKIDYETVPSRAGMNYRGAFARHDSERYCEYLEDVNSGEAKMNASVLFPHDIVHAYMADGMWHESLKAIDETLELKWKNLPNCVTEDNGTLVVVDGSGSMCCRVGNEKLTAHDVARALGIYFAERLKGVLKNTIITFSANPKLVRFNGVTSLRSKIYTLMNETECSNTDIEKTFDLILKTAIENHLPQEEIPANLLIISDMEFDAARKAPDWSWYGSSNRETFNVTLFDAIKERWDAAGYKIPRLVFWNVNSRTGTIPVKENDMGVALVSGFSPMIADMVMSGELDPYDILVNKLRSERYNPVWKVVMPS